MDLDLTSTTNDSDPITCPTGKRARLSLRTDGNVGGPYGDLFGLYKDAVASIWTPEEVDLTVDRRDWNEKMTPDEREFIKRVLAFFLAADAIVIDLPPLATVFFEWTA